VIEERDIDVDFLLDVDERADASDEDVEEDEMK
jgi:hypothetical protein